ncbi:MAG: tripartite tricarboxylate transporter TctB family protein [Burkholderiaceae bacterium]
MSDNPAPADGDRAAASTRTLEITVALILFVLGAIVVYDSYRLGSRWGSDGPQSGYFPFYIGLLICIASAVTLVKAVRDTALADAPFVYREQFRRVLTVLIPAAIYVLLVKYLGMYVASAIYIAFFMIWLGHYAWWKGIAVGVVINAIFFAMFEVWFKVPLFKGVLNPLGFLGY